MYNFQVIIYCALICSTLGEKCTTPTGQPGECVPLSSCSSLLWSFANAKSNLVKYLKTFLCASDTGLRVCCRVPSDFLVFEDEEDTYDPNDVTNVKLVNEKSCGVQVDPIKESTLDLYHFPWLVKLMIVDDPDTSKRNEKLACTGVLISARYILYSVQCHRTVLDDTISFFVTIQTYTGKSKECQERSYSKNCSTVKSLDSEAHSLHPFYDAHSKLNDIAVLRLSERLVFSDYVRPICLPLLGEQLIPGQLLFTAGWNKTFSTSELSVKTAYSSSLISNQECKQRLAKDMLNEVITMYDMCSINPSSVNDMEGIGFPIMSLHKNRWYLQGFTSRGLDYKPSTPKIHTRVQNYLHWIQENIGGERCLTPFNETGECVHLSDCPTLLDAYANSAAEDEDALREFVCQYDHEDSDDQDYILRVCCGDAPNFTILHRDDYISDDDRITVDEFPWLAVILNATEPEQRDGICGGTLITQRYVLTSALCSNSFFVNDTMMVRLGDYNLKNARDCIQLAQIDTYECSEIQEYGIEEEIVHPFHNENTFINNIALLRLDKKVAFSDYVRPICLPRSEADLGNYGDTLYTTGFGDNDKDIEGPKIKKKIRTTLISLEECRKKMNLISVITPFTIYHFCSEDFQNSTDVTCNGDEGGPVMHFSKFRWFIEGISSTSACRDYREPQSHLKVFKYLKWIKLNIKD